MSLRLGTWTLNANGQEGDLTIQRIDASGVLDGVILGVQFKGLWNEVAQSITFSILDEPTIYLPPLAIGSESSQTVPPNLISPQIKTFVGYLFSTPTAPPPGADIDWTLAGYFLAANAVGGTSRRNTFGWFAQTTEVV
jgi:hypothetical protein